MIFVTQILFVVLALMVAYFVIRSAVLSALREHRRDDINRKP